MRCIIAAKKMLRIFFYLSSSQKYLPAVGCGARSTSLRLLAVQFVGAHSALLHMHSVNMVFVFLIRQRSRQKREKRFCHALCAQSSSSGSTTLVLLSVSTHCVRIHRHSANRSPIICATFASLRLRPFRGISLLSTACGMVAPRACVCLLSLRSLSQTYAVTSVSLRSPSRARTSLKALGGGA